jgi:predicted PurR-regulated permease PerM
VFAFRRVNAVAQATVPVDTFVFSHFIHAVNTPPPAAEQSPAPAPASGGVERRRVREPAPLFSEALTAALTLLPELKLLIGLLTAAVIVVALYFGRDIVMPLALALLLGFVLDPLVGRLKRWGLPRPAAVVIVVAFALALLASVGLLLGKQVSVISAELPTYQSNMQYKLRALRESAGGPGMFDGVLRTFDTLKAEVDKAPPADAGAAPKKTAAAPLQKVQLEEKAATPFQKVLSWLELGSGPLATAGIVFVFVVLVLLDRVDLRDRLLRLWSGSLHRSTDALDEAGERIGKYLTMQLVVNLSYGVPMAVGLWVIGVPGAILWGMVAAAMRFVPYLGPMIASVFPLMLAVAVDPGWSMVLWTVALIVALELLINNIVEPWLYGASTGLSAMSLIVSATFWTALWGPIGLIMSTPLTVCLLVVGRHLPRLQFLDVLLGSQPALDTPTRLYQRLLAGDVEEAIELAIDECEDGGASGFYDDTGVAVLRMASSDHASVATAEHRHRVVIGMEGLIDDLREQHPAAAAGTRLDAVCIGGKWQVDTLAAKMLAHAVSLAGWPAEHRDAAPVTAEYLAQLDLRGARAVCLSYFSAQPQVQARHFCKRLRRRWPDVKIVLALWNAPPELLVDDALEAMGADAVVTSVNEAVLRLSHLMGVDPQQGFLPAPIDETDPQRLEALRASGAEDARAQPIFDAAARRAADIFDVPMATVTLISEDVQTVHGAFGRLGAASDGAGEASRGHGLNVPRSLSMCGHVVASAESLVVPDISRDIRFAGNPALQSQGLRFYAGAPLRDAHDHVLGTLCLLDVEPRTLSERDVKLLQALADDVMQALRSAAVQWAQAAPLIETATAPAAALWGHAVPAQ